MSRQILNGWKEISNHIERGVRTAQRWEVLLGMPVHRPALKDRSAVVAFSDELDRWISRMSNGEDQDLPGRVQKQVRRSLGISRKRQEPDSLTTLLDKMHQKVEFLSHELVRLRNDYAHMLDHVPYPALLTDRAGKVDLWNRAAQKMFIIANNAYAGIGLSEIPVQQSLRQILSRKHRAVVERGNTVVLRNQAVQVTAALYRMDVHFASLSAGILVVFRDTIAGLQDQRKMNLVGSFAS